MSARLFCAVLVLVSATACEQLVGADFGDLKPRGVTSGSGGSGGTTDSGSGGASGSGGTEQGGMGGSAGLGGEMADAADAKGERADDAMAMQEAAVDDVLDASAVDQGTIEPSDAPIGQLVINEMEGAGDDWIELYNVGPGPIQLDGYGVAQASGTNGPPDLGGALIFPAGTTLAQGGYVIIVGKQVTTGGPGTMCAGVTPPCYSVTWGISSSSGEGMYLLRPNGSTLTLDLYPPPTIEGGAPLTGQTWGRIPNGTGDFVITPPTPNADNHL